MANDAVRAERVFKTAWFSKAAKKSHISDIELCIAIAQVMLGQADDLGGGIFKKRLSKNNYRSIILAKGGRYWVYSYLFAKKDQANISDADLTRLRAFAELYSSKSDDDIAKEMQSDQIVEICNEEK